MILTLKELADYLRVSERTITEMVDSGHLQGARIGGQWRFNSSQIDALFFPQNSSAEIPPPPVWAPASSHQGITLSRVMNMDRMVMDMKATDVEGVVKELADVRLLKGLILDLQNLQTTLLAREKLLSTAVGNGLALPHPRDPVTTLRAPAIIVFGRSVDGVEYGASDGEPVHLFFMLCSQNIEMHLHLMGRLAHLLRHEEFVELCKACDAAEEVMRLVLTYEREEFLHGEA